MERQGVLSVVLPLFNEAEVLPQLHERLTTALRGLGGPYELVFVDDGSNDASFPVLLEVAEADPSVRIVRLSRNFGHQVAITAGLDHAVGSAVVVMDADLQHPPELIPELVAKWRAGADVVFTIRVATERAPLFKRLSASLFYAALNRICEVPITPNAPDFRLLDRRVVDALRRMPERSRFLRGLVSWVGFTQVGVPFVAAERRNGRTKYSLTKMIQFSLDGVTAFSKVPLRLASFVGLLAAVSGIPYAIWAVYARLFTDTAVHGWASIVVALLFLGGVQLMAIGIIGEYLGRIFEEVKGRPLYVTDQVVEGAALSVQGLGWRATSQTTHQPAPEEQPPRPVRVHS